jgi:hypothetical protein
LASLEDLPMPSPHRRALKLALEAPQLKGKFDVPNPDIA